MLPKLQTLFTPKRQELHDLLEAGFHFRPSSTMSPTSPQSTMPQELHTAEPPSPFTKVLNVYIQGPTPEHSPVDDPIDLLQFPIAARRPARVDSLPAINSLVDDPVDLPQFPTAARRPARVDSPPPILPPMVFEPLLLPQDDPSSPAFTPLPSPALPLPEYMVGRCSGEPWIFSSEHEPLTTTPVTLTSSEIQTQTQATPAITRSPLLRRSASSSFLHRTYEIDRLNSKFHDGDLDVDVMSLRSAGTAARNSRLSKRLTRFTGWSGRRDRSKSRSLSSRSLSNASDGTKDSDGRKDSGASAEGNVDSESDRERGEGDGESVREKVEVGVARVVHGVIGFTRELFFKHRVLKEKNCGVGQ